MAAGLSSPSVPDAEEAGLDDLLLKDPAAFFDEVRAEALGEQGPVVRLAHWLVARRPPQAPTS
jgi:hypothetical protein